MASSGPLNPGTVIDDSTAGSAVWSDPSNAATSNNVYASVFVAIGTPSSHYLKATNFGFAIPSGATIDGIEVEVERKKNSGGATPRDFHAQIVKGGSYVGTDKATATTWPGTDTYATYGGAADLWGTTWTDSDINASDFGFGISVQKLAGKGNAVLTVDHIRITVYYTAGSSTFTATHTTDGLKRVAGITKTHTTSAVKKVAPTTAHTTDAYILARKTKTHTTDALRLAVRTKTHTTDTFLANPTNYTKGGSLTLPSGKTDLDIPYTTQEYTDVATSNNVRVAATAHGYTLHMFKQRNADTSQKFTPTVELQTSIAPSDSPVYLEVYNNVTGLWETLDSDSTSDAATDFTLTGTTAGNATDYYDSDNRIAVRIYQEIT